MATFTVTTANWDDSAFWASVGPAGPGNTLDFSGLPSNYTVVYNYSTGEIAISDGTTTFTVGDSTASGGPYDATMGGPSELNFFDFLGSQGDDTIIADGNANDIDGSGGTDEVVYSESGSGVDVNLSTGSGSGGDAAGDTYSNVENVTGSDHADTITGDGNDNVLTGGAGGDTLSGGGGNDTFVDGDPGGSFQSYSDLAAGMNGVAQWSFEETSGATATDSFGTNNATYLNNTNPNVTGVDGSNSAVYLNGNNSSNGNGYVDVPHDASLALSEGTFQLWINPDTVTGTYYIFDKYDGNGAQEGLRLWIDDGVLYGSITDNYSTQTISGGTISSGDWQHVGISFGNGSLSIYADGVEVATTSSSGDLTGNSEELWIGARQDGSYNENHFQGSVDEFTVHDVALTEAQMAELATAGPAGGASTVEGDVYDGGTGIDEVDYSGSTEAVNVNLSSGTGSGGSADGDSYTDIENVTGSTFDDTITGSTADNVLDGGAGDDTLTGGTGDDTLTGGDGDDTFTYTAGDGADTITDFNTGNTGTLDDGDNTNNDFIDLSAFYDTIWELTADQSDDGILNQSNDGVNGVDYSDNTQFAPGDSLTFTGASADSSFFTAENTGVICFAAGTRLLTPRGKVAVETLRVGDEVMTCDHGAQPIRWIKRTRREWGSEPNKDKPILIRKGSLGAGLPVEDLQVSPQHRMLIPDHRHVKGVFVPAKAMVSLKGVRQMQGRRQVEYVHLLLDQHHVIFAEGAPTESFFPGRVSLQNLAAQDRDHIRKVVLRTVSADGCTGYRPAREFYCLKDAKRRIAALERLE